MPRLSHQWRRESGVRKQRIGQGRSQHRLEAQLLDLVWQVAVLGPEHAVGLPLVVAANHVDGGLPLLKRPHLFMQTPPFILHDPVMSGCVLGGCSESLCMEKCCCK